MSDKIQVSKIEITIGDKTLSLSVKELKDLKAALDTIFPNPVTQWLPSPAREVERVYIDRPYRWEKRSPMWGDYEVTCDSSKDGGTLRMMASTAQSLGENFSK